MMKTKIFGFGALQEIGKACIVIEHDQEIVIIDAGIKFANSWQVGIEGIIPDYAYLKENQKKIQAIFITHGHEDHIGGVSYLLEQIHVPKIYASRIACEYIKARIKERRVRHQTKFEIIEKDLLVKFKNIQVDFWTVQHSIPDSFGIRVRTPNGTIANTGDFRIDYTPIGVHTDFKKIDLIGKQGVEILFSDSTNAMRPDHSPTEASILKDIEKFIKEGKKKVFLTTFSSRIERIGVVIELAEKLGKKVCLFGRSMVNSIKIAIQAKYINIKESTLIDKKEISKYDDNELFIITTGSQGEENAALSRMSRNKDQKLKIQKDDIVIFSSSSIPGNHSKIELLINQLAKLGAIVKEHNVDGILHTSGHAYRDEHRLMFQKLKPTYFIPFHGEYRMSVAHAKTAIESGILEKNVFLIDNGQVIELINKKASLSNEVIEFELIYIDGVNKIRETSKIINEREKLSDSGFIHTVIIINKEKNIIVGKPKVISRGTLFVKTSQDIMNQVQKTIHGTTLYIIKNKLNWTKQDIQNIIKKRLEQLFYKEKRRRPMVMTTIIFLKTEDYQQRQMSTKHFKRII